MPKNRSRPQRREKKGKKENRANARKQRKEERESDGGRRSLISTANRILAEITVEDTPGGGLFVSLFKRIPASHQASDFDDKTIRLVERLSKERDNLTAKVLKTDDLKHYESMRLDLRKIEELLNNFAGLGLTV